MSRLERRRINLKFSPMHNPRNAAAKIRPRRIVYISCNPDTLVADLRILMKKGYRVEKCVAVDMFPYTDAIEAVVALSL